MKKFLAFVLIVAFALPCYSLDTDDMPDTATLSANRMRFDAETGDFLAEGNVTIQAGELNVEAPTGSGNVDRREINFTDGIVATGKWQEADVDIKSGRLLLSFFEVPTCRFQNGVRGNYGPMAIDADGLILVGIGGFSDPTEIDSHTRFLAANVRNLEDKSRELKFGANSVEGVLREGVLQEMTADKNVWIKGRDKGRNQPVSLRGDKAVYAVERGSVVVSGHVIAIQGGRTLKSDAVIYFPDESRVEALGGLTREIAGVTSTDRAEITIDLSREPNNSNLRSKFSRTEIKLESKDETPKPETKSKSKTTTKKTSSKSSRKTTKK